MLQRVDQHTKRCESFIRAIDARPTDLDPLLENAHGHGLVLLASGLIEIATESTFSEYGRRNGNEMMSRFVSSYVQRLNSIGCDKIETLCQKFDKHLWSRIEGELGEERKIKIDSLKSIRDQIAHGRQNGTSIGTIRGYFSAAKDYAIIVERVVLS